MNPNTRREAVRCVLGTLSFVTCSLVAGMVHSAFALAALADACGEQTNRPTVIAVHPGPDALEKARQAAAAARAKGASSVVVELSDGTYRFTKPVVFGEKDSGVTYRAAHPGKVRFTGGVELPEAKPWKDDILVADLTSAGVGTPVLPFPNGTETEGTQVVWNDEVLRFARWPNDDFAKIAAVDPATAETTFTYGDARIDRWKDEAHPYACGFFRYNWAASRIAIAEVDAAKRTVRQAKKPLRWGYGYGTSGFWFGYNLLCELDAPGEAYVDVAAGKAYFIPSAKRTGVCEVTVGTGFVDARKATGLVFEGIVFENCRGRAVSFAGCRAGGLRNCDFRNIGMRAVTIEDGRQMTVEDCRIVRCGAGGVYVRGGDALKLAHAENVVSGCRISQYSLTEPTYAAAVDVGGCGCTVRGNVIHDGPHVGIIFGGREHLFESNELYRVCVDSGEMGAFYCGRDWTLVGNVVRGNFIHDIDSKRSQPNRAFMWDDGAAGLVVTENVVSNVLEGISLSAVGDVVESNVFYNVKRPMTGWQAWLKPEDYKPGFYTHESLLTKFREVPVRKEPWISRYPFLAQMDDALTTGKRRDPATRTRIEGNVFIGCPKEWITPGRKTEPICAEAWDVRGNVVKEER